jgi:hypothetical protein
LLFDVSFEEGWLSEVGDEGLDVGYIREKAVDFDTSDLPANDIGYNGYHEERQRERLPPSQHQIISVPDVP